MSKHREIVHDTLLWVLALLVAGSVAWLLHEAFDYYRTPLAERPHHEDYREYRPAGRIGHGVGIVGSTMVLLLLLYSLRKRWKKLQRLGRIRIWLRYHIFLGVAGPVLITLHTSFKFDGLVVVSYWSMLAVAGSGLIGRYLYQQIPRNVLGESLSVDDVEHRNEAILVELTSSHGADQSALADLERLALVPLANWPAPVALLKLPLANLMLARNLRAWQDRFDLQNDSRLRALAREWVLAARRLLLFHMVRDLFHWWHVFHKPFAVTMILVMIIHVAVAVALGYTWLLGSES